MNHKSFPFIFFGTPDLAVFVLEELEKCGFIPAAVVTAPDRPAGRGMKLTPPPVKTWAQERNIPVLQPETLDTDFIYSLPTTNYSLFIVAAYGKIIPENVLDVPQNGTLNVHPSLLPKYRGPSPIESAILAGDEETGVTIMEMDEKMDHGPIVESEKIKVESKKKQELSEELFRAGGKKLAEIIPQWIVGKITSIPQDHSKATYTKKLKKEDGLITISDDPETNWCKFRAYTPWPGVYFFSDDTRIKITDAAFENGAFIIKKIIPEGKKETDYSVWMSGDTSTT